MVIPESNPHRSVLAATAMTSLKIMRRCCQVDISTQYRFPVLNDFPQSAHFSDGGPTSRSKSYQPVRLDSTIAVQYGHRVVTYKPI
jgi:hypothetical protein